MKAVHVFYCGSCGVASEDLFWVVCRCKRQKVYRIAIRAEDEERVRAAIRDGGRVRVGQDGEHHDD